MEAKVVYSLIYLFADDDTGTGGVFTSLDGAKAKGTKVMGEDPEYVKAFVIIKLTVDSVEYDGEVVFNSDRVYQ